MLPRRTLGRALGAAAALLLTGCAAVPQAPPDGRAAQREGLWEARRRALEGVRRWALEGRFALTVRAGMGRRGWQGRLSWRHAPQAETLVLADPTGAGLLRLRAGPGGAALAAFGARREGPDGEALLAKALGRPLPLRALARWVLGLPAPGPRRALALDEAGRVRELAQGPWRVRFLGYRPVGELELPAVLEVRGRGLRLRLAVHRWRLG